MLKTIPAVSSSNGAALRDISVLGIPPAIISVIETPKNNRSKINRAPLRQNNPRKRNEKGASMKKRSVFSILLLVLSLWLTGCDMGFGTKHVEDPKEYGKWESYLEIPSFLPDSVEGHQVNGYSYTVLAYMDICYEIFLDLTVSQEALSQILSEARANPSYTGERKAYYCDGYSEIVFEDFYEIHEKEEEKKNVGWADIEKIVYHLKSGNVIFVCFHANDTGVYNVDRVAYFQRFSIEEGEYVKHLPNNGPII